MLLPLPLDDDNQMYIERQTRQTRILQNSNSIAELSIKHSISFYIILHHTRPRTRNKLFKIISVLTPLHTESNKGKPRFCCARYWKFVQNTYIQLMVKLYSFIKKLYVKVLYVLAETVSDKWQHPSLNTNVRGL